MELKYGCVATAAREPNRIARLLGAADVLHVAFKRFHDGERLRLHRVVNRRFDGCLLAALLHEKKHAEQGGANENGSEMI